MIKNAIDAIEAYQLYISYYPLFAHILFQWSMVAPNNFCIKPVGGGSKILHYFFKIKKKHASVLDRTYYFPNIK